MRTRPRAELSCRALCIGLGLSLALWAAIFALAYGAYGASLLFASIRENAWAAYRHDSVETTTPSTPMREKSRSRTREI